MHPNEKGITKSLKMKREDFLNKTLQWIEERKLIKKLNLEKIRRYNTEIVISRSNSQLEYT